MYTRNKKRKKKEVRNKGRENYLIGQQQVPDLNQVFLGEDKAHISTDVGKQPVKEPVEVYSDIETNMRINFPS